MKYNFQRSAKILDLQLIKDFLVNQPTLVTPPKTSYIEQSACLFRLFFSNLAVFLSKMPHLKGIFSSQPNQIKITQPPDNAGGNDKNNNNNNSACSTLQYNQVIEMLREISNQTKQEFLTAILKIVVFTFPQQKI